MCYLFNTIYHINMRISNTKKKSLNMSNIKLLTLNMNVVHTITLPTTFKNCLNFKNN